MSKALLIVIAGLVWTGFACRPAPEVPGIPWAGSYPLALEAALGEDKPMFVYFSADWCSICSRLERETLADAAVREAMAPYIALRIDVDKQAKMAEKYLVDAIPAIVILNGKGEVIRRTAGFQEAAALVAFLRR